MRKALVNYWVDLATAVAFMLCAVTGIVFLFPGAVHTATGASPTILLIPATWWHSVHDWTGVAMVAGTALHLALHARWIATMTRRTFGSQTQAAQEPARRSPRVPDAVARPAAGVAAVVAGAGDSPPGEPRVVAGRELERLERRWDTRRRENERRHTRKAFLTGAAAVGAGVLLAGVGLLGKDAVSSASARLLDDGWTGGGQVQSGASTSAGGASDGSVTGGGGSTTTTVVSVNEPACVACGRCLQVCPKGVFDWSSSGRAEAVNGDACIRCGRCLQVCPAGAITVNA